MISHNYHMICLHTIYGNMAKLCSGGVGLAVPNRRVEIKGDLPVVQFIQPGGVEEFSALSEVFGLFSTSLFKYFQLRHALRAQKRSFRLPLSTRVENSSSKKGLIAQSYLTPLNNKLASSKLSCIQA